MQSVHQSRPVDSRLFHQRIYATDDIAAGTHTLFWDPSGPSLVPVDHVNYRLEGVGAASAVSCEDKQGELWLVGVMLGSAVNLFEIKTNNGTPLDSIRFDGAVRVPFNFAPKQWPRFDWTTDLGAINTAFLFELVWARF